MDASIKHVKAVILAGGLGTRLAEETSLRPKPMVEIGGKPILWHIMNIYSHYEVNEFVLALGYMGEYIKEYFLNFYAKNNDITVDLSSGRTTVHQGKLPSWKVHLADTGASTQTGGRVKRLERWLQNDQTFMLTYGDGVSNVDIGELLRFHRAHGKLATMTAVRPPSRFGEVDLNGDAITHFNEKPQTGEGWINGGFFVMEREVLDYIEGDNTYLERDPLERLAAEGQLMAFRHPGFWQPMDTLREKRLLEELWQSGKAPWKVWE